MVNLKIYLITYLLVRCLQLETDPGRRPDKEKIIYFIIVLLCRTSYV